MYASMCGCLHLVAALFACPCVFACMRVRMFAGMRACMFVCMHACMYVACARLFHVFVVGFGLDDTFCFPSQHSIMIVDGSFGSDTEPAGSSTDSPSAVSVKASMELPSPEPVKAVPGLPASGLQGPKLRGRLLAAVARAKRTSTSVKGPTRPLAKHGAAYMRRARKERNRMPDQPTKTQERNRRKARKTVRDLAAVAEGGQRNDCGNPVSAPTTGSSESFTTPRDSSLLACVPPPPPPPPSRRPPPPAPPPSSKASSSFYLMLVSESSSASPFPSHSSRFS